MRSQFAFRGKGTFPDSLAPEAPSLSSHFRHSFLSPPGKATRRLDPASKTPSSTQLLSGEIRSFPGEVAPS